MANKCEPVLKKRTILLTFNTTSIPHCCQYHFKLLISRLLLIKNVKVTKNESFYGFLLKGGCVKVRNEDDTLACNKTMEMRDEIYYVRIGWG